MSGSVLLRAGIIAAITWTMSGSCPMAGAQEKNRCADWETQKTTLVADESLVAYYDFQDGAGNILKNKAKTGAALDGIITGAVWDTGRWPGKKALRFDGKAAWVAIPHHPALYPFDPKTGAGECSIEIWFKPESLKESGIVDKSSEGWGKQPTYAVWLSSNRVCGYSGNGAASTGIKDPVEARLDGWTHVVFTINDLSFTLYKNGMMIGQEDRRLDPRDNGKPLLIGCMKPGLFPFAGLVDEVAVYNRALDAKEVRRHYRIARQ